MVLAGFTIYWVVSLYLAVLLINACISQVQAESCQIEAKSLPTLEAAEKKYGKRDESTDNAKPTKPKSKGKAKSKKSKSKKPKPKKPKSTKPEDKGKSLIEYCEGPPTSRIVGGADADMDWPWIVYMQANVGAFCGGTLIKPSWVMTAAHCFLNDEIQMSQVWANSRDLQAAGRPSRAVKRFINHPQFDTTERDRGKSYDISLVELSSPFELSDKVQPACIMAEGIEYNDTDCYSIGWGSTDHSERSRANILQQLRAYALDFEACMDKTNRSGKKIPKIIDKQMCAFYHEPNLGACYGDSGSPFNCRSTDGPPKGRMVVTGVTSTSFSYCNKPFNFQFPNILTRIDVFHDWIRETIGES